MKIYEFATNPSSRRVGIFLKELGIEVDRVQLNVRDGENLTEEYLEKSINGKVPMLELDDGTAISESVAICRYFANAEGDLSLFGETAVEAGKVEMWHRIVEFDGLYAGFQAFRNLSGVFSDRERCVKAWGEESKLRVEEFLPKLDKQLSRNEFIAGDKFSIVDITGFMLIDVVCLKALEIQAVDLYPNIKSWYERMSARPTFQ
ncbi:glutathione S-transferase family protein [Vibrio rumoiensis]|uniref:Glutathione S-transferase n=1 Tax=Vibrio rumoiensis 1S-45 TaxID=1188252 RepID=A0A1E5E6L2_9VIBR|nr:glutathione S-transferase [Vibrio rumoiensis]OEF30142.1 glutathione S-transferase [Vibrio rumoiensis 1S-45]